MIGKLIWLSVLLIVAGTISLALVVTNANLMTRAQAYVQTIN